MALSEDLQWRGLIKDKTFDDVKWLDTSRTFYLGVDCSSDSLTIGNLAILLVARRLREAGWKAVLLVGGATSLIGDPGGKDEERELKSRDEISHNVAAIKGQVERLFAGQEFELVDNYDWFKDINYLEFLREVGKHYSMTELVQRDYIAARMGGNGRGGISYAEFSYSLIQGYDYYYLHKNHGVELQIGGSDQWGNMLSGAPLIRKKAALEGKEVNVHAFSMPLVINKLTGKKFGKSEEGAIWLDAAQTSVTQFYQFWMNADDAGVEDYLKVYTMLNKDDIEGVMARQREKPSERIAQSRLALEVTALVHGEEAAERAQAATGLLTGVVTLQEADDAVLEIVRAEQPNYQTTETGGIIEALTESGLATSNTDARRLLADNAISVNGQKVAGRENFTAGDFHNGRLLLRKGKKFKDTALIEL